MADNKQAFINQALAWENLSEDPNNPNGLTGSYRFIFNSANIYTTYTGPWCAAFVSACAKQAGILNIVPANTWAYGIGKGIIEAGGKSIPGMASSWHCEVTPAVGDTVQVGSGDVDDEGIPIQNDPSHVSHVGIIIGVDKPKKKFTTIEGNSSDKVNRRTYSFSYESIYYLARPNWEAVGGFSDPTISIPDRNYIPSDSDSLTSSSAISVDGVDFSDVDEDDLIGLSVYSDVRNLNPNDRHDMTIREICYFSDEGAFTTSKSDVTISAINYTTLLGNLYDNFARYYPDGCDVDLKNLHSKPRTCIDYLINKGLNPAAACGITGAIYTRSHVNTGFYPENQTKYGGLCGWGGSYFSDMKKWVGVNSWTTNYSAQLNYLWRDLELNYSIMLELLKNVPISVNGARQAANRFIVSYRYSDEPQDIDTELNNSTDAQYNAAWYFDRLIITACEPEGTTYSEPTVVTIPIATGSAILTVNQADSVDGVSRSQDSSDLDYSDEAAPAIINRGSHGSVTYSFTTCPYEQAGIDRNYMSYSYWANHFASGSNQRKLADIWKGLMTCNRGIAQIYNHYLVAVGQHFGSVGDALEVELSDGTKFLAIIADAKNPDDNNDYAFGSPWGHVYKCNNKLNVIEWQAVDVVKNHAVFSESSALAEGQSSIDIHGWEGKAVKTITNYGPKFVL